MGLQHDSTRDSIQTARIRHSSGAVFEASQIRIRAAKMPLHVHRAHALTTFVDHGHWLRTPKGDLASSPGSLAYVQGGIPHANVTAKDLGLSFASLEFQPEAWRRLRGTPANWDVGYGVLEAPRLAALVVEIVESALCKRHDRTVDRAVEELLAGVEERTARDGPRLATLGERCSGYLLANRSRRISMPELGRWAGFHPDHVGRRFRAELGMSPREFLLSARIDLARSYLRRGLAPAEAAAQAGFSDQAHLTRAFRRICNVTPGHYRELIGRARVE